MIYTSRYLRYQQPHIQGPDVLFLQQLLSKYGFLADPVDGVFDLRTERALRYFQESANLTQDGITSPYVWNKLQQNWDSRDGLKTSDTAHTSITVDVDRRRLYFYQNDKPKVYRVAVGKRSTPTPLGHWVITQKAMNPGGPFGARWMRLSVPWGGYGIHGTNNPKSIGKAVSHGCIRMYNRDVIEIYPLTPIGTPVEIIGKTRSGVILQMGNSGAAVRMLQQHLKVLGFTSGPVDGRFGRKTRVALVKFQKQYGLPESGRLDPQSSILLHRAFDEKIRDIDP